MDSAEAILEVCRRSSLSTVELRRIEDGVHLLREAASIVAPETTVAQHAPRFLAGLSDGTRRTYRAPILRLVFGAAFVGRRGVKGTPYDLEEAKAALDSGLGFAFPATNALGPVPISRVTVSDLLALIGDIRHLAAPETTNSPVEHFVRATRAYFEDARFHGLCHENPARQIRIPERNGPGRLWLKDEQFRQLRTVILAYHHDDKLAMLIIDAHEETAARRSGIIGLNLGDIDLDVRSVRLLEKNRRREQPASRELLERILALAHERGSFLPGDPAFVQKNGMRITDRVYDGIFGVVDKHLPWAKRRNVAAHALRRTTIQTVRRARDEDVARAFAGHRKPGTVTEIYSGADDEEVRDAHAAIFLHSREPETRHGRFRVKCEQCARLWK